VASLRAQFGDDAPPALHWGRGCRECQGTGYHGRTGIFETMLVTSEVRAMILERASVGEIRRAAVKQGMMSLRQDGWRLVRSGHTTVEEVLRVTKDERFNGNGEPVADAAAGPANTRTDVYTKPSGAGD
jgi:type II secretory ATPase GspE/PulE/Tfp pilus assembly ATPase PilB-like protein